MLDTTKRFRGEIRPLTGLRGVAAIAVVLYHFVNGPRSSTSLNLFDVPNGYLAVDLFFVLSGFVLAYNYSQTFVGGFSRGDYKDFIIKRLARIYPPYFCIMLFYIAKMAVNYSGDRPFDRLSFGDYVGNLLLMSGWGLNFYPLIGPSWSVSAEMFCYFLFPFIILVAFSRPVIIAIIAIAASAALAGLAYFGQGVEGPLDLVRPDTLEALCRAAAGFSIGIMCYWVHLQLDLTKLNATAPVFAAALYTAIGAAWLIIDSEAVRYACLVAIVLIASSNDRVSQTLLGNRVVHYAGQISYSIYLVHVLFLSAAVRLTEALDQHLASDAAYVLGLALYLMVVLVFSHFSYHLFEMRGRQFLLSLPGRRFRSA